MTINEIQDAIIEDFSILGGDRAPPSRPLQTDEDTFTLHGNDERPTDRQKDKQRQKTNPQITRYIHIDKAQRNR